MASHPLSQRGMVWCKCMVWCIACTTAVPGMYVDNFVSQQHMVSQDSILPTLPCHYNCDAWAFKFYILARTFIHMTDMYL